VLSADVLSAIMLSVIKDSVVVPLGWGLCYLVMMIPSMKRSIWVTAEFFRISSTKQIHSGNGPRVYLVSMY